MRSAPAKRIIQAYPKLKRPNAMFGISGWVSVFHQLQILSAKNQTMGFRSFHDSTYREIIRKEGGKVMEIIG
jgi:hypothetical protein